MDTPYVFQSGIMKQSKGFALILIPHELFVNERRPSN